jgi:hypothetical protein
MSDTLQFVAVWLKASDFTVPNLHNDKLEVCRTSLLDHASFGSLYERHECFDFRGIVNLFSDSLESLGGIQFGRKQKVDHNTWHGYPP